MSRNKRVEKFEVSFQIELYGATASEAFARACELQLLVVENLRRKRVADYLQTALDAGAEPVAGIEGAPHGLELDGWRCVYRIGRP